MKRSKAVMVFKKGLAMALVAAMTLSLASCGGKKNGGSSGGGVLDDGPVEVSESAENKQNNQEAKQNVYKALELDMSAFEGATNKNVVSFKKGDDGYESVVSCYTYTEDTYVNDYYYAVFNTDGSMKDYILLSHKEEEGSGEVGIYQEGMESVILDDVEETGEVDAVSEEDVLDEARSGDVIDIDPVEGGYQDGDYSYESDYLSYFSIGFDGFIYAYGSHTIDKSENGEYTYLRDEYVVQWDKEGNETFRVPLEEIQTNDEEYFYVNNLFANPEGGCDLIYFGSGIACMSFAKDGTVSELKKMDGNGDVANRINNVVQDAKGNVFMTYYADENWENLTFSSLDLKEMKLGDSKPINKEVAWDSSYFYPGYDSDLVYCTYKGMFKYNFGDEKGTMFMNYVNSDVPTSNMNNFVAIDDKSFFASYYYWDGDVSYDVSAVFNYVDPADIPDKNIITIAGLYISYEYTTRVVNFNRNSDNYRIVVKDYSDYNTDDDYEAGQKQLNNDIIGGNMPDILVLSYGMPVDSYVSKGLFMNIDSLMEEDPDIDPKDYVANIMDALRVDGKLYYIAPYFDVKTFVGKRSIFGAYDGFSFENAKEVVSKYPDAYLYPDFDKQSFLNTALEFYGNQYVDLSEGKCNFGDGDFKELLEFANENFPESLSDDYYNDDYFNNYETRFMNDNALLYQTNMYSTQDMVSTLNGTFGGEGMFVGLPSSDHSKAVAAVYNRMAISAKSEYVSGAWAFLKYYLTDEYQDSIKYDVPIKESSFRKFLDAGKEKPYYMDNDRKVEYDYSFWAGDKSITIDPLSDEQIADIENTIRGIKRLNWSNDNISNIITEEVPAYFSGQKSVDDVVNIIQNRAQIYVDENY